MCKKGKIILHWCIEKCCMQFWNLLIMYWFVVLCSAHTWGGAGTWHQPRSEAVCPCNIVSQVSPDSPPAREGGTSVIKKSEIRNYREGNWSMTNGHKKRMIGRDEEMDRDVLGIRYPQCTVDEFGHSPYLEAKFTVFPFFPRPVSLDMDPLRFLTGVSCIFRRS